MAKAEVDVFEAARGITINVELKRFGKWTRRLRMAYWVMRIAVKIAQWLTNCNFEIGETEEGNHADSA